MAGEIIYFCGKVVVGFVVCVAIYGVLTALFMWIERKIHGYNKQDPKNGWPII